MKQCKAKAKSTQERCKRSVVPGKEVCRYHGGLSLSGVAHPGLTQGGRYSKYMPKRLLEHYQASLKDKELIALRDELALVDARLNDVLKRVDSGESGQLWWELRQTAKELDAAQAAKDMPAANILLADIRNLIERGAADYATWNEAMRLVEQRRKLSDSERRRVMDAQNVVTSEQAMLLVTVLSDSVRRHVSDKDALRAISEDINRYVLSNPVRESASSGDGA